MPKITYLSNINLFTKRDEMEIKNVDCKRYLFTNWKIIGHIWTYWKRFTDLSLPLYLTLTRKESFCLQIYDLLYEQFFSYSCPSFTSVILPSLKDTNMILSRRVSFHVVDPVAAVASWTGSGAAYQTRSLFPMSNSRPSISILNNFLFSPPWTFITFP